MKIKSILFMIAISISVISCMKEGDDNLMNQYKMEIMRTEKAFATLAKEEGLKVAFLTYAAENAVLNRGNKLIKGKKAIREYYESYKFPDARLEWEPEFIDISNSGDLAYTYGPYRFEATDEAGKIISDIGIFHTIWKRQSGGEWRYVWD